MSNLTSAELVDKCIKDHYTYNDQFNVNTIDLISHLLSSEIDSHTKLPIAYVGIDVSDDKSLAVIHFKDRSVLIVGSSVGVTTN